MFTEKQSKFSRATLQKVCPLGQEETGTITLEEEIEQKHLCTKVTFKDNSKKNSRAKIREAEFMRSLHHPLIIDYKDMYYHEDHVCLLTEYPEGQTLAQKIKAIKEQTRSIQAMADIRFKVPVVLKIICQLAEALIHMHKRGIVHRNINLDTVFVKDDSLDVKLMGFENGLCLEKIAGLEHAKRTQDYSKSFIEFDSRTLFLAPEILYEGESTPKSDVWSLGILMFCLLTFEEPLSLFSSKDKNYGISEDLFQLLKSMIQFSAEQRPDLQSLLRNPVLSSGIIKFEPSPLKFFNITKKPPMEENSIFPNLDISEILHNDGFLKGEHFDWERVKPEKEAKWVEIIKFKDDSFYEGQMKDEKCHGIGRRVWPDLAKLYEGEWHEGYPHGLGRSYNMKEGQIYEGEYKKGKMEGKGILVKATGESFTGDFKNGKLSGHAVYRSTKGDRYEGEYLDGVKHGEGVFTFADSKKFEGSFKKGKQHGEGTIIDTDGNNFRGVWDEGKLEQPSQLTENKEILNNEILVASNSLTTGY